MLDIERDIMHFFKESEQYNQRLDFNNLVPELSWSQVIIKEFASPPQFVYASAQIGQDCRVWAAWYLYDGELEFTALTREQHIPMTPASLIDVRSMMNPKRPYAGYRTLPETKNPNMLLRRAVIDALNSHNEMYGTAHRMLEFPSDYELLCKIRKRKYFRTRYTEIEQTRLERSIISRALDGTDLDARRGQLAIVDDTRQGALSMKQ